MHTTEARDFIQDQDRLARQRLRAILDEHVWQAGAHAEALIPWMRHGWVQYHAFARGSDRDLGRLKPEAERDIHQAYRWTCSVDWERQTSWRNLTWLIEDGISLPAVASFSDAHAGLFRGERPEATYDDVKGAVSRLRKAMWRLAKNLETCDPEKLLDVPDEIPPPRHGRIADGVLARLVAEDLAARIEDGRGLERAPVAGRRLRPAVPRWLDEVAEFLSRCFTGGVADGFRRLTRGTRACDTPLVIDADGLGRAYLAFGLNYLEEVRERMPDYAEAAGQAVPSASVSISGGTFYGGQFAGQIANVDSTIAGIVRNGGEKVAEALSALQRAVLNQQDLDDEQRKDLLDNVESLAEAAQTPPDKRKRGTIKAALAMLSTAAATGVELNTAMDAWGGVLRTLLP